MNDPRQLIDSYLDEQLDEAGAAELQRWLATDRENLREFMRATAVHRGLRREFVGAAARDGFAASTGAKARIQPSSRRLTVRRRRSNPWLPRLGLVAAACLLVALGALLLAPQRDGAGHLVVTSGSVLVDRQGSTESLDAGGRVRAGDVLNSNDASVVMRFSDGSTLTLAGRSELVVGSTGGSGSGGSSKRLHLRLGRVQAEVAKQPPGLPLVVETSIATATVLGTEFSLTKAADSTRLDVDHGRVRLERTLDQAQVEVGAGEYAVAAPRGALVVRKQGTFPGDQPLRVGGEHGNLLLAADGQRFVMKGAQVHLNLYYRQLGSSYEALLDSDRAMYRLAFAERSAQLDAMKACGINTVRIFVSPAVALDPNNGYRTAADGYGGLTGYIQRLVTYADDARSRGFQVIICAAGDGTWSDDGQWPQYRRFYNALVPALKDNGNVLYELFHQPDIDDREWTRVSKRSIDLFRSLGHQRPLIVGLNHFGNWWYEAEVEQVARHDAQLVFSLGFARWVGWQRTADFLRHGAHHAVILGTLTREVNGDVGESEAIAAAAAMRDLVERGLAVGVVANGWNIRDAKPPLRGNGMTDDDGARMPNSWGSGYRDQYSGRLPDWLPVVTTPGTGTRP